MAAQETGLIVLGVIAGIICIGGLTTVCYVWNRLTKSAWHVKNKPAEGANSRVVPVIDEEAPPAYQNIDQSQNNGGLPSKDGTLYATPVTSVPIVEAVPI